MGAKVSPEMKQAMDRIKSMWATGNRNDKAIVPVVAKEFGISTSTIYRSRDYRDWAETVGIERRRSEQKLPGVLKSLRFVRGDVEPDKEGDYLVVGRGTREVLSYEQLTSLQEEESSGISFWMRIPALEEIMPTATKASSPKKAKEIKTPAKTAAKKPVAKAKKKA